MLKEPAFQSDSVKKLKFLKAMKESLSYHYDNSLPFRNFIDAGGYDILKMNNINECPYLPISVFKEMELITGPKEAIKTRIMSSATTSGKPSIISLDESTMRRQQIALQNIMHDFLPERRIFIVFDARTTVEKKGEHTSSRATAIRGFTQFAKKMKFVLDGDLGVSTSSLLEAVDSVGSEKVCVFGFTWLIYQTCISLIRDHQVVNQLRRLPSSTKVLHIGGWKKLKDLAVDKKLFNETVSRTLGVQQENVIDVYGMTEQLGTIYPDCEAGHKHMPLYSDIIIRSGETLKPLGIGEQGLIQFLTPIPNSYPGISILTEDVGELRGIDDCPCKRKGKYFVFKKRVEKAPIKGCGDTL
jgi:hypothetical protein